ncbi:MAG TPA: NUDIX hydrolase [Streptosporangiaceae bacterium]|nr:NUDIX hydrolase [Streptosporangiaceae bacterium]
MSEDPAAPPLPAIPASAGALIFDGDGRLLILKSTYKKGWTIPGGVMEADGESPWEACQREVREETALDMRRGQLVCVDFRRPRPGRPGGIRFLFHCGMFGQTELGALVLQEEEIAESRVLPLPEALPLLSKPVRRRVRAASRASGLIYLEDGHPVEAVGAAGGDSA